MNIRHSSNHDPLAFRLRIFAFGLLAFALVAGARLFTLMVLEHDVYTALAAGSQEIAEELVPLRGEIFVVDSRTGTPFPIALNQTVFTVYADTREIDQGQVADIAEKLTLFFSYDEEKKATVLARLSKMNDPYEPIELGVSEEKVTRLQSLNLPGIKWIRGQRRFYPEGRLAAQTVGFVGKDEKGEEVGRYGIEGYWQRELAGSVGFLGGARGLAGNWIPLAGRTFEPAEDGATLTLTIDRTLQFQACERLRKGLHEYGATSASLVLLDPKTGAIRALCSLPDFDPNDYRSVEDPSAFYNSTIFTPYEPGSVFKPITMAAALNEGLVRKDTVFHDTGSRDAGCQKSIRNAADKVYGSQTMTGVLTNSINTGLVFIAEILGTRRLREYAERFGFGVKEGLALDTEVSGKIDALDRNSSDEHIDCYTATASFGQGITATPIQLAVAFGAIANGGVVRKPFIVEEMRFADGRVEKERGEVIREAITPDTARLLSAMLVQVVEEGHGKQAKVPGYYIAGKTGTAQISGIGGYTEETNHTFIGFGPVEDPRFVLLVKFEKPQARFAETTAVPVFGDIAKFVLEYLQVPPTRL